VQDATEGFVGAEAAESILADDADVGHHSERRGALALMPAKLLFTYEEAAHMLGMKHRNTIYNLVKRGELKPTYVSSKPRISKTALEEYIDHNTVI